MSDLFGNIVGGLAEGLTGYLNTQETERQKQIARQQMVASAMQLQQAKSYQEYQQQAQQHMQDLQDKANLLNYEKNLTKPYIVQDGKILQEGGPMASGVHEIKTNNINVKQKLTTIQATALTQTLNNVSDLQDFVTSNPTAVNPGLKGYLAERVSLTNPKFAGKIDPVVGQYRQKVNTMMNNINNLSGVTRFNAEQKQKIIDGLDPTKTTADQIMVNLKQLKDNAMLSLKENDLPTAEEMKQSTIPKEPLVAKDELGPVTSVLFNGKLVKAQMNKTTGKYRMVK